MSRSRWLFWLLLALVLFGLLMASLRQPQDTALAQTPAFSLSSLMGEGFGESAGLGFARADGPHKFIFPRDHGPHQTFRSEWWYLTGQLRDAAGQRYGIQLTFFRFALRPGGTRAENAWANGQIYMAHLGWTDVSAERFVSAERMVRGAAGLAGAQAKPFKVWLDHWSLHAAKSVEEGMQLSVSHEGLVVELDLQPQRAIVFPGKAGWSIKGAGQGNGSYYYAIPRIAARGTLSEGGQERALEGELWLDREWSTSSLEEGLAGWDWLALQFKDGRELMYYRLRTQDGKASPYSAGYLNDPKTGFHLLSEHNTQFRPTDYWKSRKTGVQYPVSWQISVDHRLEPIQVHSLVPDQEHNLSVRYWEGAVDAWRDDADAVLASGYLELAGY